MKFTTQKESHIYSKFFFFQNLASERLTLVYRASTQLVIRIVPVFGATQYSIFARNSEAGPFKGTCHTSTYMCDIMGLRPASAFTLWLRTCIRETFLLCDLRAIPLDVITLPEGT